MFARWVRRASDERLGSVMRSPLRGILLWQAFRTICQRFDRSRAARVDAVVEFRIRGRRPGRPDRFQVAVAGGSCTIRRRREPPPTVTLDIEPVPFLRLVAGAVGAPSLLLAGR
jgi:hypothetical protein